MPSAIAMEASLPEWMSKPAMRSRKVTCCPATRPALDSPTDAALGEIV